MHNPADFGFLYILDNNNIPVKANLKEYIYWRKFNPHAQIVKREKVKSVISSSDVVVSTVFLGLDHGFSFDGNKPVLFESLVSGGEHDNEIQRYLSWREALDGHNQLIKKITK